jgi:hypothetical protein
MNTQGIPMKPTTAALAVLTLSLILTASPARAQYVVLPGPGGYETTIPAATYTNFPSYSYWTAAYYGYPPRIYVGLGSSANDFPYYGRPYGSPSDPWSWPAMAGYASGVPTRYYPVLP